MIINSFILLPLCTMSWIFTLVRFRAILRQGVREAGIVTLQIWGMLFFFTITITFLIVEFVAFFNAHTFPNLTSLIANSAFLTSQYFSMAGILTGMGIPTSQRITRWLGLFLSIELIVLAVTYFIFFVSNVKPVAIAPLNVLAIMLDAIGSFFAIIMFIAFITIQLIYFPSKKFPVIRLRTALFILCVLTAMVFLSTRIATFIYYPLLMPPMFIDLSYTSFIGAILLFFLIFLSNKLYARFVITSRSLESWRTFQDLQSLVERLMLLCPVIGMPPENPGFWRFLFNPEFHLYRAVIIILDSRALLADFLAEAESMQRGIHPFWEDDLRQKAIHINKALQSANPSNEFSDIVETYRRVSRDLFVGQMQQ